MREGGGFGIWLEQRTGKTLTAIKIADTVQPAHLWIICPKAGGAAPEVWWREIGKWMKEHHGLEETQIRVENYEQWVSKRKVLYKEAKTLRDLMIICDESHYIKARGASRSRTVRHLGTFARWRLALTGTPIAQGIHDAWAQFNFIDPAIFGKFDNTYEDPKTQKVIIEEGFEGRYLILGGYKKHDVVGFKNEEEFYEKFHAHSYRKTLREARDKPLMLKYTQVPVELKKATRAAYEELKRNLITEVNQRKIKVKNVLSSLIKPYDGKFNQDAIVMQIQAGIAVDMAKADCIIFYSIDFSMLNFEQARFRILDFNKPVGHYYFINAIDTIDEDIYLAITRKKSVAIQICDTYRTRTK
jgi:superfamily II DNA or RNA helicase